MENVINPDYNGCIISAQLTGYLLAEIETTNDSNLKRNIAYLLEDLYTQHPTWMSEEVLRRLKELKVNR